MDTKPLIAGISVTGFTVGFAMKEIATNFLSGVLLVLTKPFQKGQMLRVMLPSQAIPLEGKVHSIDARYVSLIMKDGSVMKVPSSLVYTNCIIVTTPPDMNK